MHKLGAELGVRGMSLYNHVAGTDDVLDGVVEVVWSEIEGAAPATADWRHGMRAFAHAIRIGMHRHPNAASLISSRQIIPRPALRAVQSHIAAATRSGLPEKRAYALLRTLTSYALGTAQAEVCWGLAGTGCRPAVGQLLRPGTPGDLAAVTEIFCGQADTDVQFELGLDLMLRGIDCPLE
ncbi:TetR/AcrR family transcriptional regulator C-terminal domain-containing protein [Actinomadura sp. 3N407]|uniref:TetR/AcrR family transcriptional regulator C-terminal domain-containing protein n=1 Tax=Actinomadura sp. 3N407 TaxID=3457423 RepID=UPI003FCDADC5